MNEFNMTINNSAKALGLDVRTIRKRLSKADITPTGKEKGFDVYFLGDIARICFSKEVKQDGKAAYNVDELMPKDKADHFTARKRELEVLQAESELIPYNEAADKFSELSQTFGKFFDTFIDDLEQTGLYSTEQLDLMEKFCDQSRTNFVEAEF